MLLIEFKKKINCRGSRAKEKSTINKHNKYLGVKLSKDLKWKPFVMSKANRLNKVLV